MLAELLKRPENRECMDCRARNPTWASINLGVFVCIRCSGLHRQVGVHISKVRSCTMDLWEPEQIAFMQTMGNERGKAIYEALLPPDYGKPGESEDSQLVLQWIRTKYEKRRYYSLSGAAASTTTSAARAAKPSDGSDILTLAMARPRKQKPPRQVDGAGSPATPAVESPINYTYDQFMSPSVQSPRAQDAPSFEGASAFGFLNSGTPQPCSSPRDEESSAHAGSGFAFISHAPPEASPTDEAPASTTSAFAFIASPAGSPAAANPQCEVPPSRSQVDVGPPSLMDFSSNYKQPLIPGHFASPDVANDSNGIVFDPFSHAYPTSAATPATTTSHPVAESTPTTAVATASRPSLNVSEGASSPTDPQALLLAMQHQMRILQQQLAGAATTTSQ